MPKTRKPKRKGGSSAKSDPLRFKFKLGGRKSSTSALSMSTKTLLEKYETTQGRNKPKIAQVLTMRGVHIGTSAEQELATENED